MTTRQKLFTVTVFAIGSHFFFAVSSPAKSAPKSARKKAPTYAQDIAPILNKNCVDCHRPGEVAPFSLLGYDNAKKWSHMVAQTTESRLMPPWKATAGFGDFKAERRLSEDDISKLQAWMEAGAPRGDRHTEPSQPKFSSSWALGKPDLEISPAIPYELAAEGHDVYRNFVIHTNLKQDTWINGMDIRPGAPKVVHHVIIFVDNHGMATKLEKKVHDGQPGYETFGGVGFLPEGSLGGWAPGVRPNFSPKGTAMRVPAGSDLVIQVHYHKSGKVEKDLTRVALYEAKQPVKKELDLMWWMKFNILLPAGDNAHHEIASKKIQRDVTLYGVMPHMHYLGKSMEATATLPDGKVIPLIKVDNWDFNWQINYTYKQPLRLPKGTVVKVDAVYDNSAGNPRNPNNPPKAVTWGEQTTDEMFLLLGVYSVDGVDGPLKFHGFN